MGYGVGVEDIVLGGDSATQATLNIDIKTIAQYEYDSPTIFVAVQPLVHDMLEF